MYIKFVDNKPTGQRNSRIIDCQAAVD